MLRKSSVVIAMSTMVALTFATGTDFTTRPSPTPFKPTIAQPMEAVAGPTLGLNAVPTLLSHRSSGMTNVKPQGPFQKLATINGQVAQFLAQHTMMSCLVAEELPAVDTAQALYVTAKVRASRSHYSVQYWDLTAPEPINRPLSLATSPANTHLLTISGTAYRDHAMAVSELAAHLGTRYLSESGPLDAVPLIPGFDAAYYPKVGLLTWREGDWTIAVDQGSEVADQAEGREIIASLDSWALPPFPGILTASLAPSAGSGASIGDIYALDFADGNSVYQINPFYNHAPNAFFGLVAPFGTKSPQNLVEAANRLVPTTAFYDAQVAQVVAQANPDRLYAGQYAMISGQLLGQNGQGMAHIPFSMTGLPEPPHYLNGKVNGEGRFSRRIFFPHAGTYIMGVGNRLVGTDVTVHVLPAPIAGLTHMPPVVQQALTAISGKTTVPLLGPAVLPGRPYGYLTAQVQALPSTYVVFIVDTTRPLGVNGPEIDENLTRSPMVAEFSLARLRRSTQNPGTSKRLSTLTRYNPRYVVTTGLPVKERVNLGLGIHGTVYLRESKPVLNWQEGDWAVQFAGGSLAREIKAAQPLVAYLQRAFLPPYPGIFAVQLGVPGSKPRPEIDWIDQNLLAIIGGPGIADRPVTAATMAVHWQ